MKILLLVLSLISEIGALCFVRVEVMEFNQLTYFFLLHILACVLASYSMMKSLPNELVEQVKRPLIFFFFICLFVPFFSFIGAFVSVVESLLHPKHRVLKTWIENPRETLPSNPRDMLYSKFGTGALRDILMNSPSVDRRVDAITSVSRLPRSLRISFYKLALRDPADDVRLLAYSQLDPLEQEITDNIKDLEVFYNKSPNADTAYDIAQQFWELCYLGISEGVLFNHYISKSNEWCQKALSHEDRPSFNLLQGRIYLSLGKNDEAKEFLEKALRSNMQQSQISPYLAECAFNAHDYKKVREIVNDFSFAQGSKLSHIKEYWFNAQ